MNSQVVHHTTLVCIPDEGGICMRAGDDGFGYPATGNPPKRQCNAKSTVNFSRTTLSGFADSPNPDRVLASATRYPPFRQMPEETTAGRLQSNLIKLVTQIH